MAKKKSKKQKKPNIPVETLARPRLEQIMARHLRGEIDSEAYVAAIRTLMDELGREAVLNALIGQLDNATPEQKDALMVAIPKLGDAKSIERLWSLVRRSKMSAGGKMTALVILKQMGEDVDLEDPSQYLSWRDIKQSDLAEISDLARFGLRAIAKELQQLESADEVEGLMLRFEEMSPASDREEVYLAQIEALVDMADTEAADMLAAMAATTGYPQVRTKAQIGLSELADRNVVPQTEVVKELLNEQFYAAYSTDPSHPWQQGVILVFERGRNLIQAMVFLLDYGHPWRGSVKDMFVTYSMPPQQFQREMLDKIRDPEAQYLPVPYSRARQFILDAVEANRKYNVKLPSEFQEFRPLIERRILSPSPETLAYAEEVDDQTVDAWGELEGEPVRGLGIIGPEGEQIRILSTESFEDEDEVSEFEFEDLLGEVNYYYEEEAEELEVDESPVIPQDWVFNYLVTRHDTGTDPAELRDHWENITDFMAYLDLYDDTPEDLAGLEGYHLSEFIIDYWDEYVVPWEEMESVEDRKGVIDSINDLYAYLSEQNYIPPASARRVVEATKTLFSKKNELTPISR